MQLRMYRVPKLFKHLEYNLNLCLLAVTLVRNFVVSCHLQLSNVTNFYHDHFCEDDINWSYLPQQSMIQKFPDQECPVAIES